MHGDSRDARALHMRKTYPWLVSSSSWSTFFHRAESWISTGSPEDETRFNPTGEERVGQASLSKRTVAIGSRESGLPREIVRRRMKKPAEPDSLLSK